MLASTPSNVASPVSADAVDPAGSWSWWRSAGFDRLSGEFDGAGTSVGVLDDGVHHNHAELRDAYDASRDRDFADGDFDAFASNASDYHGTGVAGVISADPGGASITGGAHGADLVAYRLSYASSQVHAQIEAGLDAALADDLDVLNCSFGEVGFFTGDLRWSYARAQAEEIAEFATHGRDGLGGTIVFSAGNDGAIGNDVNFAGYAKSIHTIAVGGYDAYGRTADFAQAGEALLLSAQARSVYTTYGVNSGAYWSGTSFSAPQVSAIVALMLEANPDLGARDVQEILAVSADHDGVLDGPVDLSSYQFNGAATWNGGGMHFDRDFGFGFADAHAAARIAEHWRGQKTFSNMESESVDANGGAVPDDGVFETSFRIERALEVDSVELALSFSHADYGQLRIELVSASGATAVLMDGASVDWSAHTGGSGALSWSFTANRFWGEDASGLWTLRVVDQNGDGAIGSVSSAQLTVHGDQQGDRQWVYTDAFDELGGDRTTLRVWGSGREDTLNAAAVTSDSRIDINPNQSATVIDGVAVTVAGGSRIENVVGGDGDDRIRGNYLDNWLHGGRGDDVLFGHRGDNALIGGQGRDGLVGGRGVDYFTFGDVASDGWDRVMGFERGVDKIDLRQTFEGWAADTDWSNVVKLVQKGDHANLYVDFDFDHDGGTGDDVMVALIRNVDADELAIGDDLLVA